MTEQKPEGAKPEAKETPKPTPPAKASEKGKQPPWGKPEDFDAEQAWDLIQNLRKEKGVEDDAKATELQEQLDAMKKAQADQTAALAKALGVAPEETSGTDKLAESLEKLQEKFAATQRKAAVLELAAKPGEDAEGKALPAIPPEYHHLLTATEPDALAAQAKAVAELVAVKAAQSQTPGFAESAGQGQNGGPTPALPAQIAAAETDLRGKTPGTPEYRAAQQKVMDLKGQQLFQVHKTT